MALQYLDNSHAFLAVLLMEGKCLTLYQKHVSWRKWDQTLYCCQKTHTYKLMAVIVIKIHVICYAFYTFTYMRSDNYVLLCDVKISLGV